uniref:Interferon alpha inducible protein 27 like 1 n=1 Tax=Cairina moschata TaxID=8855 RepID=A0A8C3C044_CAIMO
MGCGAGGGGGRCPARRWCPGQEGEVWQQGAPPVPPHIYQPCAGGTEPRIGHRRRGLRGAPASRGASPAPGGIRSPGRGCLKSLPSSLPPRRGTSPAELEDAASSCGRAGGVLWQSQGELGSGVLLPGDAAPRCHRCPAPAGVTSRTLRWRTGCVTRFVPADRWHEQRPGGQPDPQCWAMISIIQRVVLGATAGVGLVLFGTPAIVSALGFKAGGIAAGSIAAKMMSAAAIANNGGVAAGSIVAVLQSIGAAGLSAGAKIGLSSTLGWLSGIVGAKWF